MGAARLDVVSGTLAVAYMTLRLVATLGRPIAIFPDSPSYFVFKLWGGVRFPVVTAFYALVGDHRTIVTLQAIIGALSWPVASIIAASVLEPRWVRDVLVGAVLLLGLTLPVTRFDNALLSESIVISLTVLLVAMVLRFACIPTRNSAIAVFVLSLLWAMARVDDAVMLGVAAIVVLIVGARRADRTLAWRLAGGFLIVAGVGIVLAGSTAQIQEYNTAQVFVRRVLSHPSREAWFERHGMPADGVAVVSGPFPAGVVDPAVALQLDRRFGRWLRDDAQGTYLEYLATHPGFVITTPFSHDGALPAFAVGVTVYGSSRRVLPDVVEHLFWPQHSDGLTAVSLLAIGIMAAAVVGAARSHARRRVAAAGFGVLFVGVANVVFITHTAGWEYERLLVPTGIACRIALLWMLAATIGDVTTTRAERDAFHARA
jgi:hypothetical protein